MSGAPGAEPVARPLRVAITGASGLIGSALAARLTAAGHGVVRLVRRPARGAGEAAWGAARGVIDLDAIEALDAVVHLAGESLASGRWTQARKRRIYDSRVVATHALCASLGRLRRRPAVLVCASAVGYYGDRGDELLDESSPPGRGFLADLVGRWEEAAATAAHHGIRVVSLRNGLVLAGNGGALAPMLPPFRLGLGGPLGDGRAWWSWIALDDVVGLILHAIARPDLAGAVNAVAPEPVRNADFTRALSACLRRPAWFPVPAFALRLVLGEMADEAVLASLRVLPARARASGFVPAFPDLEQALAHVLWPATRRLPGLASGLAPPARRD
jgi:uncharacterized protein (TIGR01777 family)